MIKSLPQLALRLLIAQATLLEALTAALQPLLGSHDFLFTFSDFILGWQTFPLAIWRRPGRCSTLQWAIAPFEAPSEGQATLFLASSLSGQVWRGGLVSVFCRTLQLFWRRCLFNRMTLLLRKEAFAQFKISYCPVFRVGGEWVATVQWHEKTDTAVKEQELEGRTEGEMEGGGSHTATLKWKCKCHFYGIEWWKLWKAFNYVHWWMI